MSNEMSNKTVRFNPEGKNLELILRAPDGSGMSEIYALWQDFDYRIVSNLDSIAIYGFSSLKIASRYKDEQAVLSFFEEVKKRFDDGKIPLNRHIPGIDEAFGPILMCEAYNRVLNTFGYFMVTEKLDFLGYHILRTYSKGELLNGITDFNILMEYKFEENLKDEEMINAYLDIYHKELQITYASRKRCYVVREVIAPSYFSNKKCINAVYSEPLMFVFARPKLDLNNRAARHI